MKLRKQPQIGSAERLEIASALLKLQKLGKLAVWVDDHQVRVAHWQPIPDYRTKVSWEKAREIVQLGEWDGRKGLRW